MMNVLEMAKTTAPLIVAIILARACLLNRLPKQTFTALWGIALARLLLPITIPSALSLHTLVRWIDGLLLSGGVTSTPGTAATLPQAAPIGIPQVPVPTPAPKISGQWAAWIWLAIGCAILAYFVMTYVRSRKRFAQSLPAEDAAVLAWLAQNKLRRPVQIRVLQGLPGPLTYGILRPVILLPKTAVHMPADKLSYVLHHEMTHIRRLDTLKKALLAVMVSVYWFNPLAWAMYILANRDLELACDECVVRRQGETLKAAYAMTLIGMEEDRNPGAPVLANFSKNATEERIHAIMKIKKTSRWTTLLAVILILGMTLVFATSASATDLDKQMLTASQTDTDSNITLQRDDDATVFATSMQWYTYEEYKAWMEQEKAALQALVGTGSKGWTPTTGLFTWTQEKVDEAIAYYEETLRQIGEGMQVSRPSEDGSVTFTMQTQSADPVSMDVQMQNVASEPYAMTIRGVDGQIGPAVYGTLRVGPDGKVTEEMRQAPVQITPYGAEADISIEMQAGFTKERNVQAGEITSAVFMEQHISASEPTTSRSADQSPRIELNQSLYAHLTLGDTLKVDLGPFGTQAELSEAVRAFCEAQVKAGMITQQEADRICAEYE